MSRQRPRTGSGRRAMSIEPRTARELAFAVLDEHKRSGRFATDLLDERWQSTELSADDRRLAAEIVHGVVRREATLDAILAVHVNRPRHRIEGPLWTLMQIGAYQLVFLSSVPSHAAVHETVETAKRLGKLRWTGFLNGILRAVDGAVEDESGAEPAGNAVPIEAGRHRRLAVAVFPDPEEDAVGYVAQAFGLPRRLIERRSRRFDFDELVRLGFWFDRPAPPTLRVNRTKIDRDTLLQELSAEGIAAEAVEPEEAVRLRVGARIESLPGFAAGWFTVQDASAMHAVRLLDPQLGEDVLDLCAAPGTKTCHLAELMRDTGSVLATDVREERLSLVAENADRLGLSIVRPMLIAAGGKDTPAGPFDAVLVDVPCSNTGVLGKRPEARHRVSDEQIRDLSRLQRRLLRTACERVKPGGRVVYSTCSIEPEENHKVVQAILRKRTEMVLSAEIEHVPGRPADGSYQALLRRAE